MKIIGIGNALVDILVRLKNDSLLSELHLEKGGMTLIDASRQQDITSAMQGLDIVESTGGSAGNAMLALAHLGAHPGFIGRIGKDEFGAFLERNCKEVGIDARFIHCNDHTGVANTFISPDSQRTFGTHLGAAALLHPDDITEEMFRGYDILHIEGYLVQNHDLMERVCTVAKTNGLKLSIDLGSYNIVRDDNDFFHHLVKDYMDIVFANEEEAGAYTGQPDTTLSLSIIAEDCETAIVKLGSKGASAMLKSDMKRFFTPAVQVSDVVDTTAAGDFFAGGFLYGISKGYGLDKCLHLGTLLSSYVIQVVGTRLSEECWNRIRQEANA